ncbi:MAG: transposase [Coxiellaceae bacterium]|nr:transposase [Coxiellaceae bacterium]
MKNRFENFTPPYAYFITFTTYGTWLHGDHRSSVDLKNNSVDTQKINPNQKRYQNALKKMRYDAFLLNHERREVVLKAIIEACKYYDWPLLATHVRSNHVHIVLRSGQTPEWVMQKIKSNASRHLNIALPKAAQQKYWTRHGSTRYIRNDRGVFPVMQYIIEEQGEKMSCFYEAWFDEITS